jgi:Flp pilus assembly protein TadG
MSGKHFGNERGVTLVMVALFIVVLFAMAALAIDLGVLYTARTSAQHAADAAALAAAYTFLDPTASEPTAAQNAAISVAAANSIMGQPVAISASNVNVDTSNRRVTVTVSRLGGNGIATFFAKVIGINSADVQTVATAEASNVATGTYCLKPFYIPNTALSTDPNACADKQVIFDQSGAVTSWSKAQAGLPMPYGIWINPSNSPGWYPASQWGVLDLGGQGTPGQTVDCNITSCLNACSSAAPPVCGSAQPVFTGAKTGQIAQGINNLITDSGSQPPDVMQSVGNYSGNVNSPSLITVAVWDNCNSPINPGINNQVVIVGYASVFVDPTGSNPLKVTGGGSVAANYISAAQCGSGGAGAGAGFGPMALPVRLVQTP